MKRHVSKFLGLTAGLLVLTACESTPEPVYQVEQVLDWYEEDGDLVVRVHSNGCSNEDSFYFYEPNPRAGNVVQLELVRSIADNCRRYVGAYLGSDTVLPHEMPEGDSRLGDPFPIDQPVGQPQGALVSYPREWLAQYYNVPMDAEIVLINPVRPAE